MALIAEYGFNEGTGSAAADSSGNSYALTWLGGLWAASAKNGSGIGSGASLVGAVGPNTAQTDFTIMAWVKLSKPAAGKSYGVLTSTTSNRWLEIADSGSALLMDWYGNTGIVTATSTFPYSTATHVAVAVAGTTSGTLYINGTAAGTATVATTGANFSAADWKVGAGNGDIGPGTSDWIDELRVFNTAENAASITNWMNTAVGGAAAYPFGVTTPTPRYR